MTLVVFTGGARSGKSAAAQRLAEQRVADGVRATVAVFGATRDAEMADRIERHRAQRPAGFSTIEATDATSWTVTVPDEHLLLVDCLGTLLGLAMEEAWEASARGTLADAEAIALPDGFEAALAERFEPTLAWLFGRRGDTIVVTNEVGLGVVPEWASARLFRDVLGRANRALVDAADLAYLVVAGRMVGLSGLPCDARWPED